MVTAPFTDLSMMLDGIDWEEFVDTISENKVVSTSAIFDGRNERWILFPVTKNVKRVFPHRPQASI